MPRTPKPGSGGPRQGSANKTYSNRTDLNTNKKLPIQVAPSTQYGRGEQQLAMQRANPLPDNTSLPPRQATGGSVVPGLPGGMTRPTSRPGEPITAGLPVGPGPGPEAVGLAPDQGLADEIAKFAPYLPALEWLASTTETSDTTRNLIRRLRGALPPEQI